MLFTSGLSRDARALAPHVHTMNFHEVVTCGYPDGAAMLRNVTRSALAYRASWSYRTTRRALTTDRKRSSGRRRSRGRVRGRLLTGDQLERDHTRVGVLTGALLDLRHVRDFL